MCSALLGIDLIRRTRSPRCSTRLEFHHAAWRARRCTRKPRRTAWISASGVIGKADLVEEVARMYGYDNIPDTRLADALPPQRGNDPMLEAEDACATSWSAWGCRR